MVKYTQPVQAKFSALSEPIRFRVLERLLAEGEQPLTALFKPYENEMSMPGVLKHVRVLEDAGLVRSKKVGRERRYSPDERGLKEFRDWIADSALFWNSALDRLKVHIENK